MLQPNISSSESIDLFSLETTDHATKQIAHLSIAAPARSLFIYEISKKHECTFIITPDTASANRLIAELNFYSEDRPVLLFPDCETLPYDHFSPHSDLISQRVSTLSEIQTLSKGIVVISMTTLMTMLPPAKYIQQNSLKLKKDQLFSLEKERRLLEDAGYRCVDTVYAHGEFAVRGALLDIFPMGSELPYRIELFDDTIDTLRTFDPETQRSVEIKETISILPAREFPLDNEGIKQFRQQWHQKFDQDHRQCPVYQQVSEGIAPAGIEYFLPLFFDECEHFLNYLPKNTHIIKLDNVENAGHKFWKEIHQRYESRRGDIQHPILSPTDLFFPVETIFSHVKQFTNTVISNSELNADQNTSVQKLPDLAIHHRNTNPLASLESFLHQHKSKVLFCVESAGRREVLIDLIKPLNISPVTIKKWSDILTLEKNQCAIIESPLEHGFLLSSINLALITESELFGLQVKQARRRKQSQRDNTEFMVKSLSELTIGSPVVHLEHGVGRYRGLENIEVDNKANEFLTLEYANEAKLYVPVTQLHLINRYSGADESLAPLHKLGSDHWQKSKEKAAKEVRDIAAELLEIYAKRDARSGHQFSFEKSDYIKFSESFPFEETPDQEIAIEAVLNDMQSDKPMDRLVCGDVGFGKTEVAMRAAFIAVQSGKQVAVLVPTTLLAQQHFENFLDRFADWPVKIDVISRFKTQKEVTAIENQVNSGKTDILIGTHKILSSDFSFNSLGLLIIDEEHRFGVKQKEKLKAIRSEVDILTLTATPIPRTLNMAMHGIRDLSIIATPPARRLSVKTFIHQYDDHLIKEAITREILRGGQVYVLHNDVKSIEKAQRELSELIPEARVVFAHGQMRERQLEQVMSDFYHQHYNVLVCTTIIETGIDIPNANTIIIERADKFGLAQLHQLRGRVGRSHHQAYAYLLTPPPKVMSKDAEKRLDAIASAQDLGAGFTLATHDLEIRGAGELLGDEQSGQMQAIGFSLYMSLLDQAIQALKTGEPPVNLSLSNTEINLHIPALIPDSYIYDVNTRLSLYKRLSSLTKSEEFDEFMVELIDRFGLLPEEVKHLIRVSQLKILALEHGIQKVDANNHQCQLEFGSQTRVDPLKLVKLVQQKPTTYQFKGANQLVYKEDMFTAEARVDKVETLINHLISSN